MTKKISRTAGVAAALVGVGVASICLAQAVNPSDQAAVKAWQTKSNIQEKTSNPSTGWQTVAAIDQGLLMRGVLAPRTAAGSAAVGLRIEYFAPAQGTLSELNTFQVDCGGNRMRAIEVATFTLHNLAGAKSAQAIAETTPDGAWGPVAGVMDGILEGTVRAACGGGAPARGGAVAAAAPAAPAGGGGGGPNPNDPAAVGRWLTQIGVTNIITPTPAYSAGRPSDQAGWKVLGTSAEGVFLTNRAIPANTLNDTILDVLVRFERFQPQSVGSASYLSQQTIYELNCRRNTTHIQVQTEFAQRNFTGQSANQRPNPVDAPAAQTPMKDEFERMCTDRGQ